MWLELCTVKSWQLQFTDHNSCAVHIALTTAFSPGWIERQDVSRKVVKRTLNAQPAPCDMIIYKVGGGRCDYGYGGNLHSRFNGIIYSSRF